MIEYNIKEIRQVLYKKNQFYETNFTLPVFYESQSSSNTLENVIRQEKEKTCTCQRDLPKSIKLLYFEISPYFMNEDSLHEPVKMGERKEEFRM
jgi:hypothetical protein